MANVEGGDKLPPASRSSAPAGDQASTGATNPSTAELLAQLPEPFKSLIRASGKSPESFSVEVLQSFSAYRGPIPPADVLAEYEKHFPGSGRQILGWTSQQIEHRQSLERFELTATQNRMDRAQLFGLVIAVFSVAAASVVAILGNGPAYVIAGFIVLAGVGGPTVARLLASRWSLSGRRPDAGH